MILKHYYKITDALIFVVDSNDRDKVKDCAAELKTILDDEELKEHPILIMANKQDIKGSLSLDKATEKLGMNQFKGKTWKVEGTTGKGLKEGLDWLSSVLIKKICSQQKK